VNGKAVAGTVVVEDELPPFADGVVLVALEDADPEVLPVDEPGAKVPPVAWAGVG
jgi:hypothetical protein